MSSDSPEAHNSSSSSRSMTLRSPSERKQVLRYGLRKAQNLEENINHDTLQLLEEVLEEVDSINSETTLDEKINNQDEVLLDSATLNVSSRVLKTCSKNLTKDMSLYSAATYANKLVNYLQHLPNTVTNTTHWPVLESNIVKCFLRTPVWNTSLLGALTPLEKKEVTKRRTITREKHSAITRPQNVVTVSKQEESVEQTVYKIRKIITRHYKVNKLPINFFKLILHPTDFAKTIENMLYVAFLVRDRTVKVTKDENGVLVIYPCTKEMMAQPDSEEGNVKIQNAMNFSMKHWKDLLEAYQIEKPMISNEQSVK